MCPIRVNPIHFVAVVAFCIGFRVQSATLGVIVSRDVEFNTVEKVLTHRISENHTERTWLTGKWNQHEVTLVKAGVGLVNAAITSQLLLERVKPDAFFSLGLCASLDNDMPIGSILIPDRFTRHDIGTYTHTGFMHGTAPHRKTQFSLSTNIPDRVFQLSGTNQESRVFIGLTLSSGDGFLKSTHKRQWIREKLGAQAVDTSGAVYADVATQNKVPCLIIRQVSDLGNEQAGSDFQRSASNDAESLVTLMKQMIRLWYEEE